MLTIQLQRKVHFCVTDFRFYLQIILKIEVVLWMNYSSILFYYILVNVVKLLSIKYNYKFKVLVYQYFL